MVTYRYCSPGSQVLCRVHKSVFCSLPGGDSRRHTPTSFLVFYFSIRSLRSLIGLYQINVLHCVLVFSGSGY
nr:MAG TPA: hypothetical protein [Caudoviricetes sp.]